MNTPLVGTITSQMLSWNHYLLIEHSLKYLKPIFLVTWKKKIHAYIFIKYDYMYLFYVCLSIQRNKETKHLTNVNIWPQNFLHRKSFPKPCHSCTLQMSFFMAFLHSGGPPASPSIQSMEDPIPSFDQEKQPF